MADIKKIVLAGYYGYNNAGDDLLLKSIISGLQKNICNVKAFVLSRKKNSVDISGKTAFVNRYNPFSIIYHILICNALIMGGGSLLQDVSGVFTIYYYFILMFTAKLFGKKLIIFNQGIGPINHKINRRIAKLIFLITDLIIVRDEYSKDFISELTNNKKSAFLGADVVFDYIPFNEKLNRPQQGNLMKVGFSVRDWKQFPVKENISDIAKYLCEKGWSCYNIPFHYPDDIIVSDSLDELSWETPESIGNVINGLDILIGMRLHSIILGVLNNIRVIAIDYDPKVKSFCEFMGIPCMQIEQFTSKNIMYNLEQLSGKKDFIGKVSVLQQRVKESWKKLGDVLGNTLEY
jgi:polysaccharide pyruvyl transferase CsaB